MGGILRARCNNCGYESKSLFYGGGYMNFKTTCKYPVLNNAEKEVQMANIMDRDNVTKQNPNLVFYDDDSLCDRKVQVHSGFHEWGNFKVYRAGYLCPKCNKYSQCFDHTGCWD